MSNPGVLRGQHRWLYATLQLFSPKQVIRGLPVWFTFFEFGPRNSAAIRIAEALDLLRRFAPARHARVQAALSGILVFGTSSGIASYSSANRLCRLYEKYVLDPSTTPTSIAVTLVHEATHGRLFDLGIGYEEPLRNRIERICIRAALGAAKRLPDSQQEIRLCTDQLSLPPETYSNEALYNRRASQLRELGCPEWFIRTVRRFWQSRRRGR